jgi:hypothetical protein
MGGSQNSNPNLHAHYMSDLVSRLLDESERLGIPTYGGFKPAQVQPQSYRGMLL